MVTLMDYAQAVEYIHGINRYGRKLGLENIARLMELLGNPQDRLRFIHVAGTNGKGSTSALLASVMRAAGYRTGLYTSPYLQRFTERIRVDGAEIPQDALARLAGVVRDAAAKLADSGHPHPTELEVVAAIAFLYYAETGCDIVVFEVGLGGRYDPTNIIKTPLAAVIATIDYDHMARLGDTLEKIAYEKAGIIKPGGDAVLYPQPESVRAVFEEAARSAGARLNVCDFSTLRGGAFSLDGQHFDYGRHKGLEISLHGDYQINNAALAVETVEVINRGGDRAIRVSDEALRRGLKAARWPGRMEILRRENPTVLIDAAHNPQCARALRDALLKYFPGRDKILIFGVLEDKDYTGIIDAMLSLGSAVFTVTSQSARALDAGRLAKILRERSEPGLARNIFACGSVEEATRRAISYATNAAGKNADETSGGGGAVNGRRDRDAAGDGRDRGPIVCAFGSLYYIGVVRDLLLGGGEEAI